ncbi:MAG: O-antigen ligase family protein [Synergistaceae bacterium]|nr:O-antigen ligase family protein [Synergistaceae bacterium]
MYVLLLSPYCESWYFKKFPSIDNFFRAGKLAAVLICAALLLLERRKFSKLLWSTIVFQGFMLMSTLINPHSFSDIVRWGQYAGAALGGSFLAEYFMPVLREKMLLLTRDFLFVLVAINTYTVIAYPQGMYGVATNFFLGMDNRFVLYTLPLICMAAMYSLTVKRRLDFMVYASLAASLFCTIATWAVGGFLGMIAVAAGVMIFTNFAWFNRISTWVFFLSPQIVSLSITVMRIQYLFEDFIVNTLHKSVTFTGRTMLWDAALNTFSKSPIFGIGIKSDEKIGEILYGFNHAHNEILDSLFRTGLLGMLGRCIYWITLVKGISRIDDRRVRGLCNMVFFTQLFMSMADTIGHNGLFYLSYMCMYHYSSVFERDKLRLQ